ncbi:MAG: hemolysin family protein [Pirellulales bacterium]|nr:hemolysin family protein [Pirellulales bacterium]
MSLLLILLTVAMLLLAGVAALMNRALRDFSMRELEQLCEHHIRPNLLGAVMRRQERVELVTELVCLASVVIAAIAAAASMLLRPDARPLMLAPVAMVLVLAAWLAIIWIAAPIARLSATKIVFYGWPAWYGATMLFLPASLIGRAIEQVVFRLAGREPQPPTEETLEDEIRTIVTEGQREGLLEEDAREMIESVMELGDALVAEVMTPRPDMLTLTANATLETAAALFVDAGHSRIPVYDKNRDDVAGVLYIKDLLAEMIKPADSQATTIAGILRPPVFVPETKPIDDLLEEFQRHRNHIAIVLNEFGGVAGLVTIEDILEEIVGEIVDEHDDEEAEAIRRIDDRTCEVSARTHLEEINEQLGIALEENGVDTVGGFVFSELGRVPRPGEQVVYKNVRLTVLEVKHRRVERIRIEVLDEAPSESI